MKKLYVVMVATENDQVVGYWVEAEAIDSNGAYLIAMADAYNTANLRASEAIEGDTRHYWGNCTRAIIAHAETEDEAIEVAKSKWEGSK